LYAKHSSAQVASGASAISACSVGICYIYGFTLHEQKFPVDPEEYASAAQHFLPMLSPETYPYMREMSEKVADGSYDGRMDFGFGLELILDGLERLLGGRTQS
jgi:hypothetical protein